MKINTNGITVHEFLKQINPDALKRLERLKKELETDIAYQQDECDRLRASMSSKVKK